MISVIIAAYNVERYIQRCVESIVKQTYSDIEIIIINDGSTDNTQKICESLCEKDDRIILKNKYNEGQGVARNLGIKLSKGKYITFVDADDWLEIDALSNMMEGMNISGAEVVTGDIYYVNEYENGSKDKSLSKLRIEPNKKIYVKHERDLINRVRLFLWGKLYQRELFIDQDLQQPAHPFEDTVIITKLMSKIKCIYHINVPVYNYLRNRQESTVNSVESLSYMITSLREIELYYKRNNIFNEYYSSLKKLAFSQVRFICKKVSSINDSDVEYRKQEISQDLIQYMDENYYGWFNPYKHKIYPYMDDISRRVVENIIFDKTNITDNLDCADILIMSNQSDNLQDFSMLIDEKKNIYKLILIESTYNEMFEKQLKLINRNIDIKVISKYSGTTNNIDESYIWDISDKILEII